jgi:hypothetical protein
MAIMTSPYRSAAFATAVLGTLVACSSASGSGGSPNDSYVQALCDGLLRCDSFNFKAAYVDIADCTARWTRQIQATLALPGVAITSAQLDACAAETRATACDDPPNPNSQCKFAGTLAAQAPCGSDIQCASRSCSHFGTSGCGVCVDPTPVGGDCSSAVCIDTAVCVQGKCVAGLGRGAACNDEQAPCGTGLDCIAGTCQPPPQPLAKGAACSSPSSSSPGSDARCPLERGLACIGGKCDDIPYAKVGEACDEGYARSPIGCIASQCVVPTSGTDLKGTCTPPLQEGAPCADISGGSAVCAEPLGCVNGKCAYPASCH